MPPEFQCAAQYSPISYDESVNSELHRSVRAACLWLPEAEEQLAHGSPAYKVRGKVFTYFLLNHHGDGRIALWLNVGREAQQEYLLGDPRPFFVPPYVGHRGWLGVSLDQGLAWKSVVALIRAAYLRTAPHALHARVGTAPLVRAPRKVTLAALDPLQTARSRHLIERVRKRCARLPQVNEVRQFGHPAWQAGRRTFAWVQCYAGRVCVCVWVGVDRQNLMTADTRFWVPPYVGHRGWIALDLARQGNARELEMLIGESYRHFAPKRLLKSLAGVPA